MRNPEIEAVFKECADLCDTKNDDYASKEDFYANFRLVEEIGLPMWVGVLIRFLDKYSRLRGFVSRYMKTGKMGVRHESIEDTFKDGINYLAIGLVCYRNWKLTAGCKITKGGGGGGGGGGGTDNNDQDKESIFGSASHYQ
ncbi:TPA: hypothetical protein DHW51_07745 [Candidatus Poribacteria bacterium]|nr:hypothetical protein [Candidatus Poribacteria bacterium]